METPASRKHASPSVHGKKPVYVSQNKCRNELRAATAEMLAAPLTLEFRQFVDTQPQPQIILGTQSASRRSIIDQIAEEFDFKYSSITADIDERDPAIRQPDPQDLVLGLAHAKAKAIADKLKASGSYLTPGYLVTCDQVVVHEGVVREKPLTADEARHFIRTYADAPATTIGACVCTCLDTGVITEDVDINAVHFDRIPDETIEALIEEGAIFDCAGGLMVEHPLVQDYIIKLEGTLEGVMGLSKNSFMRVLLKTVGKSVDEASS